MGVFQILHDFWVKQLPFFADFQILYYVLDLASILVFFRLLFSLSGMLFPNRRV